MLRNHLFPLAFAGLCAGTLLATSDAFIDSRILPKRYAFAFGIAAILTVAAIAGHTDRDRFRKQAAQHCVVIIGAVCLIEAVIGMLQFVQLWPAYGKFRVTGTFDNPAGFAAALCCGLPFILSFLNEERRAMRYSAVAATIPVVVGIVLSGSRTGMLCGAIVLAVRVYGTLGRRRRLRRSVPLLALLLLAGLYLLKKDSADGRLLVWRCSLEMIIDKPLFGHGPGGFTAEYMNYQADYFRTHPDSPYAQLADSVHHPFNEYLLAAVDYGCLGLLALIVSGAAIVRRYRRVAGGDPIIRAAGSCLLAIGVFAIFSYPFFYPFTWAMALFSLWIVFGRPGLSRRLPRCLAVGAAATLCVFALRDMRNQYAWQRADRMATVGNPANALPLYEKWNPKLARDRYFLYNYAYVLNEAGEYAESLAVAEACSERWADYHVELLRGEAAFKLERYGEAERHFAQAARMCPSRFMPLYKLVTIYQATERKNKVYDLAKRILAKEVKIPSATVTAIRHEMRRIVDTTNKVQ